MVTSVTEKFMKETPLTHIDGNPVHKGDFIYCTVTKCYDIVSDVIQDDHGIIYIVFDSIGQFSKPYCKITG